MTFISTLSLVILLAHTAISTPIQQVTSSSSSLGASQSQNTFKPFLLESFQSQFLHSRQYMMFIVRDQNFGSHAFGRCWSMVSDADGEQYGPNTEKELSWRPVPVEPKTSKSDFDPNKGLTPFSIEGRVSQEEYRIGDTIDDNGWIECTNGFYFKTDGDVATGANETLKFNLSIKQDLDKERTNGQFNGGEMIFTDDVTVTCKVVASSSETYVCLPIGESSFTFGTYEDFQKPQNTVSEDAEVEGIENAYEDAIEAEIEDEIEVEDEVEVEAEAEAEAEAEFKYELGAQT